MMLRVVRLAETGTASTSKLAEAERWALGCIYGFRAPSPSPKKLSISRSISRRRVSNIGRGRVSQGISEVTILPTSTHFWNAHPAALNHGRLLRRDGSQRSRR